MTKSYMIFNASNETRRWQLSTLYSSLSVFENNNTHYFDDVHQQAILLLLSACHACLLQQCMEKWLDIDLFHSNLHQQKDHL